KIWYNYFEEKNIEYSTSSLILTNFLTFSYEEIIFEETKHILTITQIYHLKILEKKISIPVLIQVVNLLPDITTLKIHSLLTDETTELTVKYIFILCSMKEKSKITKVYFKEINDIQELDFLFTLCPYMEYFKVGCINTMDVPSFLRAIFKIIKHNNNHHLRSLCFHAPTAVDNIKEILKCEKLLPHFTVKHILDTFYLQWK
ncbi:unnamed protein product, partial [Rotaria sp. Silwood2]